MYAHYVYLVSFQLIDNPQRMHVISTYILKASITLQRESTAASEDQYIKTTHVSQNTNLFNNATYLTLDPTFAL